MICLSQKIYYFVKIYTLIQKKLIFYSENCYVDKNNDAM